MEGLPLIGAMAPEFTSETTEGTVNFPADYRGKWVILFSHPADFTPVCTTEFIAFSRILPELRTLNCELLGLSVDSLYSHIAWLRTIKERIEWRGMSNVEVEFPLIADLKMEVAKRYGMIQPEASDTKAVRAVFYIDPKGRVQAILYYPLTAGRNMDEIKRLLISLQTTASFGVSTPADWRPGEDVIMPPPSSMDAARERLERPAEGSYCLDWFMCFKGLPEETLRERLGG